MAVTERLIVEAEIDTSGFSRGAKTVVNNLEDISDATEDGTKANKTLGQSYSAVEKTLKDLSSVLKSIEASFKRNNTVVVNAAKNQADSNKEVAKSTARVAEEISRADSVIRTITTTVSLFTAGLTIVTRTFNFLDDLLAGKILPDFQKLFLILADLAEWSGFENTSGFFKQLSSDTEKLNQRLMDLNKGYDLAVQSNNDLNKSVEVTVKQSKISTFISLIGTLTNSLIWLSDEKNLRNVSAFFRIIGTALDFQGKDELSAKFILFADSTDKAIKTLKLFNTVKNAVFGDTKKEKLDTGEKPDSTMMEGLLKNVESAKSKLGEFEAAAKLAAGGAALWFGTKLVRAFLPGFAQVMELHIEKLGGFKTSAKKAFDIFTASSTSIRGFINNVEELGKGINAFGVSITNLDKNRLEAVFKFLPKAMLVASGGIEILAEKVQYLQWLFDLKTETVRKYLAGLGYFNPTLKSIFEGLNNFNSFLDNGAQSLRTLAKNLQTGSIAVEKFGEKFLKSLPSIKSLGVAVSDFSTIISGVAKDIRKLPEIFKIITANSTPAAGALGSFLAVTAGSTAALSAFGFGLLQLDSTMAKVAGGSMIALAVAIGGITYAINGATAMVGDFIANVGFYLFDFFDAGTESAAKQEQALAKYNATIQRISANVQKGSGSLQNWENILAEITGTYQVSTIEAQNYVLSIIKLGQELQLTQNDQEQLALSISRFATSQEDLTEISNAALEALRGEGKAAERLGINLNDAAIDTSDFAVSIGKISSSMSKNEKVQAKLSLLFTQSVAAQKAFAASGDTLIKVQNKIKIAEEELSAQWSAGDLTLYRYANTLKLLYLKTLLAIPQPIKEAIADLTAFSGAFLIGAGTIMKWSLTLTASIGLVVTLNKLLQTSSTLQSTLSVAFTYVNKSLATQSKALDNLKSSLSKVGFKNVNDLLSVQTKAVVDLKSVFYNLGQSVKGVAIAVGVALLGALKKAYSMLITFGAAVLSNPMFWKAAAIVAAIYLVGKALEKVNNETSFFSRIIDPLKGKIDNFKKALAENSDILDRLGDGFSKVIGTLIDVAVVFTTTVLRALIIVMAGWMKLYELMGNDEQSEKARKAIKNMTKDFEDLDKVREQSIISLVKLADGQTAFAAGADGASDALKRQKDAAARTQKQIRAMADALLINFNKEIETIKVLGTDYEKLNARKKQLELQTNNLRKSTKDAADQAQELADIEKEMFQLQLETMKMRQDVVKKISDENESLRTEALKRSGQTIKAIDVETKAKIALLNAERDGLAQIGQLKLEDNLAFNEQIKLTQAAAQAAKNQEVIKAQEIINDLKKNLVEIQKEINLETEGEMNAIIAKTQEREKELALEMKRLELQGSLTKEARKLLELTTQANQEAAKVKIDKLKVDSVKELQKSNEDLEKQILSLGGLEQDILDAQLASEMAIIEAKKEQLYLSKVLTKGGPASPQEQIILKSLEKEKKLRKEIIDAQKAKAPSREYEGAKKVGTDIAGSITQVFQSGAAGMAMGAMAGVGAVADVIQGLIDFIPGLLDKIANIFTSLTDLPNKIASGVAKVFDSFIGYIKNFTINMINMVGSIIESVIKFVDEIPLALIELLDKVPDVLLKLIEKLPDIIPRLIASLSENIPKLVEKIIIFIIKDIPKIARALNKAMFDAMANILTGKGFKVPIDTKALALGLRDFGKKLTGEASKLFAVMDLEAGMNKDTDTMVNIEAAARKAGKSLWDAFVAEWRKAWQWFVDRGLEIWRGLVDAFLKAATWFGDRGTELWNGFIEPVAMWFKERGKEIWLGLIKPVGEWFGEAGTKIWKGFLAPIGTAFIDAGITIWRSFYDGWGNFFELAGAMIWNGFILPVGQWFEQAGIKLWNSFIAPMAAAMLDAGTIIWRSFYDGVGQFFSDAGLAIWNGFLAPIGVWFTEMGNKIWAGLTSGNGDIFKGYGSNMFSGLTDGLNGFDFGNIGTKIWRGLESGLGGIGGIISGQINNINIGNLFAKMFDKSAAFPDDGGDIERKLGINVPFINFAKGGMVPGQAALPGDSKMNDRIVALLSAGEAIIPRSKMNDPTIAALVQSILEGDIQPRGYAYGAKELGKDLRGARDTAAGTLQTGYDTLSDAAAKLDPSQFIAKLWDEMKGTVYSKVLDMFWKMLEANKFHEGGLVGGAGDVPTMLNGGEFIINKNAASSLGMNNLTALNKGQSPVSNTQNIEIKLTINSTQQIDETFIKNKLMPTIKDQLRRSSADGQTIVYANGVRNL